MARSLVRSAAVFIGETLGVLSVDEPMAETAILAVVGAEDEKDNVRKVIKTMIAQGYAIQEGEGDTATYKLSDRGLDLLTRLRGV